MTIAIRYFGLAALAAVGIACADPSANSSKGNLAKNSASASTPAVVDANLHQDDGHDAPRISLADAKKDFDEKSAVFIDTHPAKQFELEHIPGAINIQANTIKQNLDKIPKGKKIIAYCS
ncbi:MAG: rhodanese-like domain-containing protein [Pyrinomonadaceae bacterium]